MDTRSLLGSAAFPRIMKARQSFPHAEPIDVEAGVQRELARPEIVSRVGSGKSIAVGVGSRGIAGIDRIVRSVVQCLQELGGEPFIVPTMGSHGGATPQGQADVLARFGITDETMGAPVRSSLEVVQLGTSPSGMPLYTDRLAHEADSTVVINRIKPHTLFRGPVESGLMKMLAIGLGKHSGALAVHAAGADRFASLIPEMGKQIIEKGNVIFGVAVVENSKEQPTRIIAVEPERMREAEEGLLAEARSLMGRILFPQLDVLVVREIGKNISGDGMDPNVTGRYPIDVEVGEPEIQRVVALDLTEETHGNALGIGLADVVTRRLADQVDMEATYLNALTAHVLSTVKVPLTVDTDKLAIAAALQSCWRVEPGHQKMMIIENTLKMEEVYISEPALEDARALSDVEVLDEPFDMTFDEHGALQLPFG